MSDRLTDAEMRDLAENRIGGNWKHLGILLKFKDPQIEQLEMDNRPVSNAIYKMLKKWQNRPQHNLRELEQAFEQLGNAELAGIIREKITASSVTNPGYKPDTPEMIVKVI